MRLSKSVYIEDYLSYLKGLDYEFNYKYINALTNNGKRSLVHIYIDRGEKGAYSKYFDINDEATHVYHQINNELNISKEDKRKYYKQIKGDIYNSQYKVVFTNEDLKLEESYDK